MIQIEIPEIDFYCPTFSIDDVLKRLEGKSGIYCFYNKEGKLSYVGQSKNLKRRIKQHLGTGNSSDINQHFYTITGFFVDSPVDRDIYEIYMINKMKPLYNIDKVYTYKTKRKRKTYPKRKILEEEIEESLTEFVL